jgi:hypothetical protein
MPDAYAILLGGLLPMAVAAAAFAVGWVASGRAAVAWQAGIIVGYTAGVTALDARGMAIGTAVRLLVQPAEAKHWTPAIALLAVVPALAAAFVHRAPWLRWLSAAILCAAAPVWLLWGTSYLPSAEVRASGFATNAWSAGQAIAILSAVGAAWLGSWYLWASADSNYSPKVRSVLAIVAVVVAAATAGLTGSLVYAQLLGVLAASIGGCAAAGWLTSAPAGPEAAAGPIILLTGCLLFLATCLSKLQPLQTASLGAAVVLAAGWIPGLHRLGVNAQRTIRIVLCVVPLAAVLWHAGTEYAESQWQKQKEAESNPYRNL